MVRPRAKVHQNSYLEITFPTDISVPEYNSVSATPTLGFSSTDLTFRLRDTYMF